MSDTIDLHIHGDNGALLGTIHSPILQPESTL